MTGDSAEISGDDSEFEAHALDVAFADVATGEEIRTTLAAAESYGALVLMIERMDCRVAGRALLASILEDIRRQGRVLAP